MGTPHNLLVTDDGKPVTELRLNDSDGDPVVTMEIQQGCTIIQREGDRVYVYMESNQ